MRLHISAVLVVISLLAREEVNAFNLPSRFLGPSPHATTPSARSDSKMYAASSPPSATTQSSMSANKLHAPTSPSSASNVPIIGDLEAGDKGQSRSVSEEAWKALPNAPGPIRWPFFGNMIQLVRIGSLEKYDASIYRKYGPIARSKILGKSWYTVSTPQEAREVLMLRSKDFEYRSFPDLFASIIDNKGLIFTNGPEHVKNRRMSHPAFHRQELLDLSSETVVKLAKQLAIKFSKEIGSTVDVYSSMKSLTLEAVSQASFSLPLNLLSDKTPTTPEETGLRSSNTIQVDGAHMDRLVRDYTLYLGLATRLPIPGLHKIGLNRPYRKLKQVWNEMGEIEDVIIDQRRAHRAAVKAGRGKLPAAKDLLDVYLESIEQGEEENLSNESIRRNVHDVFFAGSDTTATTICATLVEIIKHPDVKRKVLKELADLDVEDPEMMKPLALAQRMPYLDICVKEALRLYPVLASTGRFASKDTVLGSYRIPKGAVIAPSIVNLHYDPKSWGPDAAEFRPERWLDLENGLPRGVPQGAYLPFGIGPRVCLGYRFALMEALAVISILLKKLDFECVSPEQTLTAFYPGQLTYVQGVFLVVKAVL